MRRPALYSSSRPAPAQQAPAAAQPAPDAAPSTPTPARKGRWRRAAASPAMLWAAIALLGALLATSVLLQPTQRRLTQKDINAAVLKTLETQVLPSEYAKAAENIRPAVVRVVSYIKKTRLKEDPAVKLGHGGAKPKPLGPAKATEPDAPPGDDLVEAGVGTGVVIVDKGIILTNLHVVSGADAVKVTFSDGLESSASITGVQPENDLAVLQAHKIPDDMIAATMRSTSDLAPGDKVIAVGFPFGIGPSVSGGVVSGLKRSFRSPEGKQEMNNLIQFDAAANPGNSGGPLVTMDGEVVGIVTAILNPTPARTFLGIGFAVPIENAASAAGLPPF
ncbi:MULTISPECIES: S1C family serine protease [Ramlibacter]|uniref:Trypsin-like serine protease n=1 Tax=Ramlibacter pinisoli TaxID=2682844 RepID=A0A6N8IZH7_9BURK|nr:MULTISPECIES: trypsin-like peptidase domain-containing protein [Ramlibacter]MBA2962507.1 trypsin-like peptidase domain-containing protein [Ramlibacter sp. CGMCC 1.13660]MVQ32449.1 trypsin-like serine protease [Ramlibacter pinisoli]